MEGVALELVGTLFGLLGLFKQVKEYVKTSKAKHEFKQRLKSVLLPLNLYEESVVSSERSGKALRAKVDQLKAPISFQDAVILAKMMTEFCNSFASLISSVCLFGDECNKLISPGFEGFMQEVMTNEPDVHDVLTFFGANYNSKTHSLNLSALPTFVRAHGAKAEWKDSDELGKEVAKGGESVNKAVVIARGISRQRPFRNIDKRVIRDYVSALRNLGRESRRLKANKQVTAELLRYAPSWFIELNKIVENVQKTL